MRLLLCELDQVVERIVRKAWILNVASAGLGERPVGVVAAVTGSVGPAARRVRFSSSDG